jgi:hypothetical protein
MFSSTHSDDEPATGLHGGFRAVTFGSESVVSFGEEEGLDEFSVGVGFRRLAACTRPLWQPHSAEEPPCENNGLFWQAGALDGRPAFAWQHQQYAGTQSAATLASAITATPVEFTAGCHRVKFSRVRGTVQWQAELEDELDVRQVVGAQPGQLYITFVAHPSECVAHLLSGWRKLVETGRFLGALRARGWTFLPCPSACGCHPTTAATSAAAAGTRTLPPHPPVPCSVDPPPPSLATIDGARPPTSRWHAVHDGDEANRLVGVAEMCVYRQGARPGDLTAMAFHPFFLERVGGRVDG